MERLKFGMTYDKKGLYIGFHTLSMTTSLRQSLIVGIKSFYRNNNNPCERLHLYAMMLITKLYANMLNNDN